jgi:hypothetical protein
MGVGAWQVGYATDVAGIVWGLLMIDARPAARLGLAVLWPLGPLAFLGAVALLLAASLVAAPAFAAGALLAATAVLWVAW